MWHEKISSYLSKLLTKKIEKTALVLRSNWNRMQRKVYWKNRNKQMCACCNKRAHFNANLYRRRREQNDTGKRSEHVIIEIAKKSTWTITDRKMANFASGVSVHMLKDNQMMKNLGDAQNIRIQTFTGHVVKARGKKRLNSQTYLQTEPDRVSSA